MTVLLHEPDFYDLGMDYLTKAASQNVRYVEMFFDPQAHTGRGVPFRNTVVGLSRACKDAKRTLGITGKLIMCFLRDHEAGWAEDILTQSMEFKDLSLVLDWIRMNMIIPPRSLRLYLKEQRRRDIN